MPRFKYSTWVIIVTVFGLVCGASFAAVRTWSAELFPGEEPAVQTQAGGGQFAAGGAGGQAAQRGTGGQAGQGAGATTGARQAGAAGGAGGQAGGGRTVGTVESLAGDTLTVTTQSGCRQSPAIRADHDPEADCGQP